MTNKLPNLPLSYEEIKPRLMAGVYFCPMTETKTYIGTTGDTGGYDGYAGLVVGTSYAGTEQDGRVHIVLPNGRPTSVTVEQWQKWFKR
jgi:hypothetical protein